MSDRNIKQGDGSTYSEGDIAGRDINKPSSAGDVDINTGDSDNLGSEGQPQPARWWEIPAYQRAVVSALALLVVLVLWMLGILHGKSVTLGVIVALAVAGVISGKDVMAGLKP